MHTDYKSEWIKNKKNKNIDETWREFLIHEVETIIFDNLIDMKLFQNEIEIFNQNVKLIRKFQWLIKSENRQKKIHSSVKIIVQS